MPILRAGYPAGEGSELIFSGDAAGKQGKEEEGCTHEQAFY